jgi:hypothetical protein
VAVEHLLRIPETVPVGGVVGGFGAPSAPGGECRWSAARHLLGANRLQEQLDLVRQRPSPPRWPRCSTSSSASTKPSGFDEHIPALDGHTPRQAADDPTRRGDLIKLLDSFPADEGTPGHMSAQRLRSALGLEGE